MGRALPLPLESQADGRSAAPPSCATDGRKCQAAKDGPCPLSTMRAPEFARGALMRRVNKVLVKCHSQLLLEHGVVNLIDQEQIDLLQEFSRAHRNIHGQEPIHLHQWTPPFWKVGAHMLFKCFVL